MIRAVIDTNVLVSAALKDREPEAVILFVAGRDVMVLRQVCAVERKAPSGSVPKGALQ
jgi:predicted nucleic acid-binding protein